MSQAEYSRTEVAKHNKADDLWIIIDALVYNVTDFQDGHPGSAIPLLRLAGQDATAQFFALHRHEILKKLSVPGSLRGITFGTPEAISLLQRLTPEIQACRAFVDEELLPDSEFYQNSGKYPDPEIFRKMGKAELLACRIAPGPHLKGRVLLGGVKPEEYDYFHEQVVHEEFARVGPYGYGEAIGSGMVIGLPPVMVFGPAWMKEKVTREVLSGEKMICLAITEPEAGSDVAGITTTAVKTPCGKFYIVNGYKKWITNSAFSHYFTTAVRTGNSYSVLLIERGEGVSTEQIKTSGSTTSGTSLVFFDNVRVPVENLIGKEGQGFQVIMANFNHERWIMVVGICSAARQIIEECFKWAMQRKVFGKPLIEQPVIRFKLGQMIAELEAVQGWCNLTTYQMTKLNYAEQTKQLGGPIALLKYQSTRMAQLVSDNAVQIFGGRAITRTGMGRMIENFNRTQKHFAVLGGSEEIMVDLGVRQAMKTFPKDAKL